MAKGKMGERVSEDAQLKLTDLVVECGYKDWKGWDFLLGAKKGTESFPRNPDPSLEGAYWGFQSHPKRIGM